MARYVLYLVLGPKGSPDNQYVEWQLRRERRGGTDYVMGGKGTPPPVAFNLAGSNIVYV